MNDDQLGAVIGKAADEAVRRRSEAWAYGVSQAATDDVDARLPEQPSPVPAPADPVDESSINYLRSLLYVLRDSFARLDDLNRDGAAVRDFVHVVDVATAVRRALAACKPGVSQTINLGSGVGTSMATVVATAEQATGHAVTVRRQPPKAEPPELIADVSRAHSVLGWTPTRSKLSEILADAWEAWPSVYRG
ncbi:NAD-dependent epimerase/dehydratase family protein [Micromonospora sp. M12]